MRKTREESSVYVQIRVYMHLLVELCHKSCNIFPLDWGLPTLHPCSTADIVSESHNYACCHWHTPLYCRAQCCVFYIGYPRCCSVSRALGSCLLREGILPDRSAERVGSAHCGSKTVARRAMQLQLARSVILRNPMLVIFVWIQLFIKHYFYSQ
jgi:hypothetical protein